MDIYSTPEYKKEFRDDSLMDTPRPQASSTVDRRSNQRFIPVRDVNCMKDTSIQEDKSRLSMQSSLGILSLNNTEDNISNGSINEKLIEQRKLAQNLLDRGKTPKAFKEFPSYLLKSTGKNTTKSYVNRNESTINLSELENSKSKLGPSEKVSFEAKEISARSSSLGTSVPEFKAVDSSYYEKLINQCTAKCDEMFEKLCQSEINGNMNNSKMNLSKNNFENSISAESNVLNWTPAESNGSWAIEQDSMIAKLQNELFTPAELAADRLLADEMSWRRERDIIPVNLQEKNLNFSACSNKENITLTSNAGEKVSVEEFFRRKTDDIDTLGLKPSPEKKHKPIPLLEVTNNSIKIEENLVPPPQETQHDITNNTLSMSQLADVLANMNTLDTPSKITKYLMEAKKPQKHDSVRSTTTEGSTLKNTFSSSKGEKTLKAESLKENSFTESTKDKTKTNNSILKETSNVAGVDDKMGNEWTDAAPIDARTPNTSSTAAPYGESPSYSCSELEFSEDDPHSSGTNSNIKIDNWIKIEDCNIGVTGVGIPYEISIKITSVTQRWLLIKVSLLEVVKDNAVQSSDSEIIKIILPSEEGLIKGGSLENMIVRFLTLQPGIYDLKIQFELTDMVTKTQQITYQTLHVQSEEFKVKISEKLLNFEILPEDSNKSLTVNVYNDSGFDIPLLLSILGEHEIFKFKVSNMSETQMVKNFSQVIPAKNSVQVVVNMCTPKLTTLNCTSQMKRMKSTLTLSRKNDQKVIEELELVGIIARCKVQFKSSCLPLVFIRGQTKKLLLKNQGAVTMKFALETSSECFMLEEDELSVEPGQTGSVSVTFNPAKNSTEPLKGYIQLKHPGGPVYKCSMEGLPSNQSPVLQTRCSDVCSLSAISPNKLQTSDSKTSPNLERPSTRGSTTSSGTLNYLQDGKLPIDSTRTELVWDCVKLGKTSSKEFVIKNRITDRLRFQLSISDPAFKLVKDQSENVSNMAILLHGMESRTITVNFTPNSIGAASAKILFTTIDKDFTTVKRQMIFLYGYGGHSTVAIDSVAKDPSGKMLLSLGRLNYSGILTQSFILQNIGNLSAFAHLNVRSKVFHGFQHSNIKITPKQVVIPPNASVEVTVCFTPRNEDIKIIKGLKQSEVTEVANLQLITGSEPTRGRIRRLHGKLTQGKSRIENNALMTKISVMFPQEQMPKDLSVCRENTNSFKELLHSFTTREIILTVEKDPECSTIDLATDETCFFQSLCNESASVTILEMNPSKEESVQQCEDLCTVEQTKIILMPPSKTLDTIIINSKHKRPVPFTVTWTSDCIKVSPSFGVINVGKMTILTVQCTSKAFGSSQISKVTIYMEDQVIEVSVKLLPMIESK